MARPLQHTLTPWELCPKQVKESSFGFNDFSREKDLCDYIEVNADRFCRDVLEEDYVSHHREWDMGHSMSPWYGTGRRTVDFMFRTDKSDCVIVECKNPTHTYSELRDAVSQLMAYRVMCMDSGIEPNRCLIVTSEYHPIVGRMIHEYSLPFELIVLAKGKAMKMKEVLL